MVTSAYAKPLRPENVAPRAKAPTRRTGHELLSILRRASPKRLSHALNMGEGSARACAQAVITRSCRSPRLMPALLGPFMTCCPSPWGPGKPDHSVNVRGTGGTAFARLSPGQSPRPISHQGQRHRRAPNPHLTISHVPSFAVQQLQLVWRAHCVVARS